MAAEARRHAHISHVSVGSSNVARATTAVRLNLTRGSNLTVPLRLFVEPSCREGGDGEFLIRIPRRAHGRGMLRNSLPRHFGGARQASATTSVAIRPQVRPLSLELTRIIMWELRRPDPEILQGATLKLTLTDEPSRLEN